MIPWRIAWRVKHAAVRAAVAPFCLILVLSVAGEQLIEHVALRLGGTVNTILAAQASRMLIETLYMAIDALLIAALLEMLLSGRKLDDSLPPLLPVRRTLRLAVALIPIGLLTSLLHLALKHGETAALNWLVEDIGDDPEAYSRLAAIWAPITPFLNAPPMQWILAGLAVPPLALRLLRLPALTNGGRAPPSTRPTPGFVALLMAAVVLATFLDIVVKAVLSRGIEEGPKVVPGIESTVAWRVSEHVIDLAGAYVLTFVMTLLIACGVATLLWRRRDQTTPSTVAVQVK